MSKFVSDSGSIGATGFLRGLSEELRSDLLGRSTRMEFAKGQIVQQRGDIAREFWFVEQGSVQVGRFSSSGNLTIFALLGPGETFGELAFIGEFPRTVDAIAGADTLLIRIREAEFQNLIQTEPSAARLLLQTMALTVQEAFDLLDSGRNLTTVQRLSRALLQLCGDQGDGAVLTVTQQELADLIGTSRVSLGKAVKHLQAAGAVETGYGDVTITSKALLNSNIE